MANINQFTLFEEYYRQWIHMYKEGSVRQITLERYYLTHREIKKRWPKVRLCDLDHYTYQQLINDYAEDHEYLTVKAFHHHCKAAITDALDDGVLTRDPTRHLTLKGKQPKPKKAKYLSLLDLKRVLNQLKLGGRADTDWLIF